MVLAQACGDAVIEYHPILAKHQPVTATAYRELGPGISVDAIQKFGLGLSIRHGEVPQMVAFLQDLQRSPVKHKDLKMKARHAFETTYSDTQCLPHFDTLLASIAVKSS